jgi:hypothetical protein
MNAHLTHKYRPPAQDSTGLQEIGFVSVSTGAVCADLGQVPNQPLVFKVNRYVLRIFYFL